MFEAELFLGVEVDEKLTLFLDKADPRCVDLFIQKDSSIYLQRVAFRNREYLGKYVGTLTTLSQLELMELNILSLLKKLSPEYSPQGMVLYSFLKTPSPSDL